MKAINLKTEEVPQGWEICRLPDFSHIEMGQSPPSTTYNQEGIGLPFFQGKAEFTSLYPEIDKYCSEPNKIARAGATLLTVRAPVGPTNLAKVDCCIGRGLAGLHPISDIESKFILFLMRSIEHEISSKGTGSTFTAINKTFLEELIFALPPLNEQKRIVAKIEELFSELDKGIESLKTAHAQLKIYRQAVLKHAFEGKLTADWREQNKDKLESADQLLARIEKSREADYKRKLENWKKGLADKPKKIHTTSAFSAQELDELSELPKSWQWFRWEDILDFDAGAFKRGPFGSALKKEFFVKHSKYKVYEQYCPINDDCSFERYYITEEKFKELEGFAVKAHDFLISCSGVTLGRITQIPEDFKEGIINQALLRVRLNKDAYNFAFFKQLFRSRYFQKRIFENSTGSAIPNVKGVSELKAIAVPLCSLEEQKQIILGLTR
jgi:type I restriction enzyme S subunit